MLFGGLIANVGAAVAFYFSSKAADQARSDILNAATVARSRRHSADRHRQAQAARLAGFSAKEPPSAAVGSLYSYKFVANGTPLPQYSVASGALPDGLLLAADGTLEGTPTRANSFTFTLKATNPAGSSISDDITLIVTP